MSTPINSSELKAALAGVLLEIESKERARQTAAVELALDSFIPEDEVTAALVDVVRRMIVGADLPSETRENLITCIERAVRRNGPGRPSKDVDLAVKEAQTVVAIDVAMAANDSWDLERACREIAKRTDGNFNWKTLKTLRANIRRGLSHAPAEAVECYRLHLRSHHNPFTELPAPITLKVVEELWANSAAKKT